MYGLFIQFKTKAKSSLSPLIHFLSLIALHVKGGFKKVACPLFILYMASASHSFADSTSNDNCSNAELISEMSNQSMLFSHTENGTVSYSSDRHDFYKYVIETTGTISINHTSNRYTELEIGKSCSGSTISNDQYNGAGAYSHTASFNVNAGDTIYVRISRPNYSNSATYSHGIEFVALSLPNLNTTNTRVFSKVAIKGQQATNIRGELKVIGNQSICQSTDRLNCIRPSDTANNNNIDQLHVNRDASSPTLESATMAQLTLDAGDEVIWAGLYWQARLYGSSEMPKQFKANTVLLKTPSTNGNYIEINGNPSKFNWYNEDGYWDYAGMQEVTEYVKSTGNYWVANVQSTEGTNMGAGWALNVVIKNANKTLKNISIYDGFQGVYNVSGYPSSVTSDITDFLTPSKGLVNSRLFFFANESDRALKDSTTITNSSGETLLTNVSNPNNNVINATISSLGANVTTRDPNYENTLGVDIDEFDVSNIIENNQTSTRIKITSNDDRYFLSQYAFTTQLYEPRVCYYIERISDDSNKTIFSDRKFLEPIEPNKNYTFDMWVSNMKKTATDTDVEHAKLVKVDFNMTTLDYKEQSTNIKNTGESTYASISDEKNADIGEYNASKNTSSWRLGSGANGSVGGLLYVASSFSDNSKKAYVKVDAKFPDSNATSIDLTKFLIFKASFETPSIKILDTEAKEIEQCVDLNTTASVAQPPVGVFNVVNENFSGSSISLNSQDPQNALYSQLVNSPFNVKVLALNNTDKITLKPYTGDVNLSFIAAPDYLPSDTEEQKQIKCDSAAALLPNAIHDNTFNNIRFNNETTKPLNNIFFEKANRNIAFKITYNDNGTTKYVCSRDSFSIRPNNFTVTIPTINPVDVRKAGEDYNITLTAKDQLGTPVLQYDQNVSVLNNFTPTKWWNRTTNSQIFPTGINGSFGTGAQKGNWLFNSTTGQANVTVQFSDVGKFSFDINDTNWTSVDGIHDDPILRPIANRTIHGEANLTVVPFDFNVSGVTIHNFNNSNFTYLSDDLNMSAPISMTITARRKDGNTTTNYSNLLYERNITVVPTIIHGSWDTNKTLSVNQDLNFTNGQAPIAWDDNASIKFNFDRNASLPINPFDVNGSDVNLTVTDTDTVRGDANQTATGNARFYYGRSYSTDYRGTSPIPAKARYEVYCKDCNATTLTTFGINGTQSPTSLSWYQNISHNITDGNISVSSVGNTQMNNLDLYTSGTISGGFEDINLSATPPYVDKIIITPSKWLIYNPFNEDANTTSFDVEFLSSGFWAGSGTTDKEEHVAGTNSDTGKFTHESNVTRANRRITW